MDTIIIVDMEKWQKEIQKLEELRIELKLNFNYLEKISGINRGQLKKIFEMKTIPSLKLFLTIQDVILNLVSETKSKSNFEKCDCKIINGLLRRGKSNPKCELTKEQHVF